MAALDSAVRMGIPMGMGMGIEMPSPRQPWCTGSLELTTKNYSH